MKSPVDLYLNADKTKVVTAGPDAASLLVNAGREIPDAEVERMGPGLLAQAMQLSNPPPVEAPAEDAAEETEAKEVEAPAENKAVKAPDGNKAKS